MVLLILDDCNTSLQMIHNVAAHLVFAQPKRTDVTLLLVSLHWLPFAARIQIPHTGTQDLLDLQLQDHFTHPMSACCVS